MLAMMSSQCDNEMDRFPKNGWHKCFLEVDAMTLLITTSNNTSLVEGINSIDVGLQLKYPMGCDGTNAR
jgi:hypothetical protein